MNETLRKLIRLFVLIGPLSATAQMDMVETERAFAAAASRDGVARAFLANLDTAGVLFSQGKAFNGMALFKDDTTTAKGLTWHPVHWVTSVSGDMGFTTGPFTQEVPGATSVQHGQFSSIWKKNKEQQWKLIADMGCLLPAAPQVTAVPALDDAPVLLSSSMDEPAILQIEDDFIMAYALEGISAYDRLINDYSWLNLEHYGVAGNFKDISVLLRKAPEAMTFLPSKRELSYSKDMLYVWGALRTAHGTSNYLRVWGNTADGWKILLQVILLPSGAAR